MDHGGPPYPIGITDAIRSIRREMIEIRAHIERILLTQEVGEIRADVDSIRDRVDALLEMLEAQEAALRLSKKRGKP